MSDAIEITTNPEYFEGLRAGRAEMAAEIAAELEPLIIRMKCLEDALAVYADKANWGRRTLDAPYFDFVLRTLKGKEVGRYGGQVAADALAAPQESETTELARADPPKRM